MPMEKRDPNSSARLFVPSVGEKAAKAQMRKVNKTMEEIEAMKEELTKLLSEAKKAK